MIEPDVAAWRPEVLADLRRHQHFEKPSEPRKRKMNAAKRKNMARRHQEA